MKRRRFVLGGATAMLAGAIPVAEAVAGAVSPAPGVKSAGLTKDLFVSCVGARVQVSQVDGSGLQMRIARVEDGPVSTGTRQFSVVLEGPRWPGLREGLYRVCSPDLGDLALYLEPGPKSSHISRLRGHFSLLV